MTVYFAFRTGPASSAGGRAWHDAAVRDYDPFAPSTLEDPAPAHRWLREQCPVHRYERFDPPFYSLARHDDVLDGLRDIDTWSSEFGQGPMMHKQGGMLDDPPGHTMFRRMTLSTFTPRAVERSRV